jgi:LacI family transcriptional regulator, galactose operon repressor
MPTMPRQRSIVIIQPLNSVLGRAIGLGAHAALMERGWRVVLSGAEATGHDMQLDDPFDVAIVNPVAWVRRRELDFRAEHYVVAGGDLSEEGLPSVFCDERAIGEVAAEHLLGCGLKRFAYCQIGEEQFALERGEGFVARLAREGLAAGKLKVVGPHAMEQIQGWLHGMQRPIGVMVGCDTWGTVVAQAASMVGLRIPEELALVSCDDDEVRCLTTNPPLSSVAVPWSQIGRESARLVIDLLEGRRVPMKLVLPPIGVTTRRSSDMLAVEDEDVAAALRFIRQHHDKPLNVPALVRKLPIYRQALERRFRKYLNRTIQNEIRRVHVERACQLLASSDLNMREVAVRSGFSSAAHLWHAFAKVRGMPPGAYRDRYRTAGR